MYHYKYAPRYRLNHVCLHKNICKSQTYFSLRKNRDALTSSIILMTKNNTKGNRLVKVRTILRACYAVKSRHCQAKKILQFPSYLIDFRRLIHSFIVHFHEGGRGQT